jgi:hypothetical protein
MPSIQPVPPVGMEGHVSRTCRTYQSIVKLAKWAPLHTSVIFLGAVTLCQSVREPWTGVFCKQRVSQVSLVPPRCSLTFRLTTREGRGTYCHGEVVDKLQSQEVPQSLVRYIVFDQRSNNHADFDVV